MAAVVTIIAVMLPIHIFGLFAYFLYLTEVVEIEQRNL